MLPVEGRETSTSRSWLKSKSCGSSGHLKLNRSKSMTVQSGTTSVRLVEGRTMEFPHCRGTGTGCTAAGQTGRCKRPSEASAHGNAGTSPHSTLSLRASRRFAKDSDATQSTAQSVALRDSCARDFLSGIQLFPR